MVHVSLPLSCFSIYSPSALQHVETQTGKTMMMKDKKRKGEKEKKKRKKKKRPQIIINEKKRK